MARSRMIRPEFWDDEKLALQTSRDARLTFIGLWNHSDDYGVVKGNVTWLKNHIFPYEDSLSIQKFTGWLTELEFGAWIIPFNGNKEKFYFIRNFLKHQTVNRPSKQRNPVPPDNILEYSLNTHGVLMDETETETEVLIAQSDDTHGVSEDEIFLTISLNDNSEYPITKTQVKEFQKLYPSVVIEQAFRDIKGWNLSNPGRRKTKSGILRHINSWLSKEQNKGRVTNGEKEKVW